MIKYNNRTKKIRVGNDFICFWYIRRSSRPEDIINATDIVLTATNGDRVIPLEFSVIDTDTLKIEVKTDWADELGDYVFTVSYVLTDPSFSDDMRANKINKRAFKIVPKSEQSNTYLELHLTSEVLTGFRGDPFEYDDFTQEQLDAIQQPILDFVVLAENAEANREDKEADRRRYENSRKLSESDRVTKELERLEAESTRAIQESTREAAEGIRKDNEQGRVTAEDLRLLAEPLRISQENDRKSNENIRITSEENRIEAEDDRILNESNRILTENDRVSQEVIRKSNEAERLINEGIRKRGEEDRESTENIRGDNETNRKDAEISRKSKETIRESNETTRVNKETIRISNESARVTAEIDRESNEDTRSLNEAARLTNEDDRIANENQRVIDEGKREQLYDNTVILKGEVETLKTETETAKDSAISAATLANEKANLANDAAQSANEAAGLADTARMELTTAVNTKLGEADAKIEEMDTTLSTYDGRVTQAESDITQLESDVSLLDAVQGAKIKDIENVLSTANLNQSAQLSVSGVSPLSLPKNTANGGMGVKLEGLTAENLVVNGDFRNGLSGWTVRGNHSTSTVIGGILNIVATGNGNGSGDGDIYRAMRRVSGNMYYTTFMYKNNGGDTCTLNVNIPHGASRSVISDTYQKVSTLGTSGSTGTAYLHIWANGVTSGANILFDNFMIINLTATFGAGNEPTKEQCDIIFSDYFEGIKSFTPTGRVRSVDKNGLNPTALYLTAPELKSNGTVKDEIRKGANGYELVKRVGVGTLGAELITNAADREFSSSDGWTLGGTSEISGGTLKINFSASGQESVKRFSSIEDLTDSRYFLASFDLISMGNSNLRFRAGTSGKVYTIPTTKVGQRVYILYLGWANFSTGWYSSGSVTAEIDNFSIKEVTFASGSTPSVNTLWQTDDLQVIGTTAIHCTAATPVITPISYGGVLNSAENGTVYHEPVIADAGVYDTKMDILFTDYPIATIEEIIKHENGVDTYLDATTAVIASDGLSFTHPDLTSGDLVLFTYAFDKETTNGNITATFYDSNVIKIDTVTGKAYRINEVVTNGVLTRTLMEV